QVRGEQIASIGSQDMNDQVWLRLLRRINELVNDQAVGGVVVTHGTDTIEESAYLAARSIDADKPIVFTGAMRAASDLGVTVTDAHVSEPSLENLFLHLTGRSLRS
nr:asparaginase domain-containing protein [Acidobacteriota bacterium]